MIDFYLGRGGAGGGSMREREGTVLVLLKK